MKILTDAIFGTIISFIVYKLSTIKAEKSHFSKQELMHIEIFMIVIMIILNLLVSFMTNK